MVDKDLNEIEVLRAMFPTARILIGHFHVIKWLSGAIRDDKKYGTYSSEVLQQMDFCVSNMVYSKSDDEFQQHLAEFKHLACCDNRTALWAYFKKNWVDCQEMWVMRHRMDLPHFRNNTNNRLENVFGKLKANLDSSMSMRQCLDATIKYQRRKEDEYTARIIMPGTQRDINYDEEMNQLLGMTSEWLADIFAPEYKFAQDVADFSSYMIDDEDMFVTLRRDGREHRVDKFDWTCSCEFSATMKLPCRHAMMYRKHLARLLAIPYSSIPARWLRVGTLEEELQPIDVPLRISTASDEVGRKKRMTEHDKFKSAQSVFSRITAELTDLPDDKFSAAIDHLEDWWSSLQQGDVAMKCPNAVKETVYALAANDKVYPTETAAPTTLNIAFPDTADTEDTDNVPPTQVAGTDCEEKDVHVHDDIIACNPKHAPKKAAAKDTTTQLKPFNPRRRVGRPRKNRAEEKRLRSQQRKEYNNGSKLRSVLRGDDVVQVEDFIKSCEPPLLDLSSYLNTTEVRFANYRKAKLSVEKRVAENVLVPYRLPESVIREGLVLIESKTPYGDVMDVSTPSDDNAECWVVTIDGIGDFTQRQLMAMQYLGV